MGRNYSQLSTSERNRVQQSLNKVAEELNNRPRKSLGFRTPAEVMAEKES